MNRLIIIVAVLLTILAAEGLLILINTNSANPQFKTTLSSSNLNPLFTSQTAIIQGKISKLSGKVLSVQNDKGIKGDVELADNVIIIPPDQSRNPVPSTSDLKKIVLDKNATITLISKDGRFKVTAIVYVPNSPLPGLLPPPATPATQTKPKI